eukprot:Skav224550  [mRNA]  locus=scaffold2085:68881:69165:+ [translate_table: standard]
MTPKPSNFLLQDYEPTEQEILDYSEWLGMDAEADKDLMWIARAGLKAELFAAFVQAIA